MYVLAIRIALRSFFFPVGYVSFLFHFSHKVETDDNDHHRAVLIDVVSFSSFRVIFLS